MVALYDGTQEIRDKILIWTQNKRIVHVHINYKVGKVTFYDEDGHVLLIRKHLCPTHIQKIEQTIKQLKFKKKETNYFFKGDE